MWIKPPGESDGECPTGGTSAGSFYLEGFTLLWDQSYFVSEQGMPKIGDGPSTPAPTKYEPNSSADDENQSAPDQTTSMPTHAPTTDNSNWNQEQTVGTVAPADTTSTEASSTPETVAPSTTAPVMETTTAPSYSTTPATTAPSTTASTGQTESTTQSNTIPPRSACKAKKRLRSL
ncbi:hypothetical protein L916_00155 [Phytophthora nicotianae]|nr:hypothetical protein L916_00155 [Phytophthora nicotianae]